MKYSKIIKKLDFSKIRSSLTHWPTSSCKCSYRSIFIALTPSPNRFQIFPLTLGLEPKHRRKLQFLSKNGDFRTLWRAITPSIIDVQSPFKAWYVVFLWQIHPVNTIWKYPQRMRKYNEKCPKIMIFDDFPQFLGVLTTKNDIFSKRKFFLSFLPQMAWKKTGAKKI